MAAKLSDSVKTRLQVGRMLLKGIPAVRIAEELGVARTSVQRWKKIIQIRGFDTLREIPDAGRPGQMSESDIKWLSAALLEGATFHGFWHRFVDAQAFWRAYPQSVWLEL